MLKGLLAAVLSVFSVLGFGKPQVVSAVVMRVLDGDTFTARLDDGRKATVRLVDIDAPEIAHGDREGQPYGVQAKRELEWMVLAERVELRCVAADQHGRLVCGVTVGGANVNLAMVQRGAAWASSKRYLRDKSMARAQHIAQASKVGLWRLPGQVEPWKWRRQCWTEEQAC